MKKIAFKLIPFLGMFLVATGSVAVSCATAGARGEPGGDSVETLNVGPAEDGRLYTTRVLKAIRSVVVSDHANRTNKIELGTGEWNYDPVTTELALSVELPFKEYVVHIEGAASSPASFVLNGMSDASGLLVILNDRLAMDGFDYAYYPEESVLVFRDDVRLVDSDWLISYGTKTGSASIGEWKPENSDRMSYIEAEHRKRRLDSWYASQDSFWFFDDSKKGALPAGPDSPPSFIKREATGSELAEMLSSPVEVMKFRTGTSDRMLSREIGFDAGVPDRLPAGDDREELKLFWKIIKEFSLNGRLTRVLDIAYESSELDATDRYVLNISISESPGEQDAEGLWIVDREVVDLGIPVQRTRLWAMRTFDLESAPEAVLQSVWSWSEGAVFLQAVADSKYDDSMREYLRRFISHRKGKR